MARVRGALIVLEGCDRVGKTTQCKKLVESLLAMGKQVKYINFPARHTECGMLINSFLTKKQHFADETIHLLFTLNRWEMRKEMENFLNDGITLIVDRYSYSGVAFTAAKGVDFEWCKSVESRLLKPDLVILLTLTTKAMAKRGGFGDEVYEIPEFQEKVKNIFYKLKDDSFWIEVDADKTEHQLQEQLKNLALNTIEENCNKSLSLLWNFYILYFLSRMPQLGGAYLNKMVNGHKLWAHVSISNPKELLTNTQISPLENTLAFGLYRMVRNDISMPIIQNSL